MSKFSRRVGSLVLAVATAVGLAAAPAAQAQPVIPDFSSNTAVNTAVQDFEIPDFASQAEDVAWDLRNQAQQAVGIMDQLDTDLTQQLRAAIDNAIEAFFPGIIERRTPKPAPAPASAPAPAPAPAPRFDYGSCPPQAKACVDIAGQRSWLQNNGQVYYGSVRVSTGKPGYETPRGTFYVNRKVKDEISWEFNNAPMPYATYFTYNGIAFHEGDPAYKSHGCVRMYRQDAQKYFNDLQIGDIVYVY